MKRRVVLVLGTAAVAVIAAAGLAAAGWLWPRGQPPPVSMPVAALAIQAPAEIAAGDEFTVTVTARPLVTGTEVLLTAQATSGLYATSATLQDGVTQFMLPRGWAQSAGIATLRVLAGGSEARQTITIRAGAAANPLLALTGPASAPIDGDEAPALVAIPLDALGNPAEGGAESAVEGAAIDVRARPPALRSGSLPDVLLEAPVQNLLAAVRLGTGKVAGILTAAAASGAAHSLQQSVRITPAELPRVVLHAAPDTAPADGAAAVALATDVLADAYGNMLPDGVAVFFVAASSDGSRRWLPAVTVDGRAAAQLTAPLDASTLTVRALVGEVASAPITITFTAAGAATDFDLRATVQEDAVTLTAGPLLTGLDALAADGTPVTFVLTGPAGEQSTHTAVTQYGFAAVTLYTVSLPPGLYTVVAEAGDRRGQAAFDLPERAP